MINTLNEKTAALNNYLNEYEVREDCSTVIRLEAGEQARFKLLREQGFYVVKEGLLKVSLNDRVLRLAGPHDVLGFGFWRMPPSSSAYTVTALQRSVLQFWGVRAFGELCDTNPKLGKAVNGFLIQTIFQADEQVWMLESNSAEARIAGLLCYLAKKFGVQTDDGTLIDLAIDREILAELAATTTVTFARITTDLVNLNILKRDKWKLVVLDQPGLCDLACSKVEEESKQANI